MIYGGKINKNHSPKKIFVFNKFEIYNQVQHTRLNCLSTHAVSFYFVSVTVKKKDFKTCAFTLYEHFCPALKSKPLHRDT